MSKRPVPRPQGAEYDDPERYAELAGFDGDFRDLWHDADFLHLLRHRLRLDDTASVLDVGCGAGHWGRTVLRELAPHARLHGVDKEAHFLTLATAAATKAGIGSRTTYTQARVEALPFPDGHFDLVTCQTVLIHVHDVSAALTEMIRVTRPGGVVLLAEPDNRAGNLALLGGEPRVSDDDVLAILELVLAYERGKIELREGDSSIGPRLPGLLAAAGLQDIDALANPNCMMLYPPYDRPRMRTQLDQERAWAADGVSSMLGTRHDVRRMVVAAGADEALFERGWDALQRFSEQRLAAIDAGTYHAAGGFVFYYVAGRKPL